MPTLTRRLLPAVLSAAALLALAPSTLAAAGQYTTLAAFQQNIRADVLLEPFNGPNTDNTPPISVSGNGYAFTVAGSSGGNIGRNIHGVTSAFDPSTRYTFTGRPVSAFAATLRVDTFSTTTVGGTIQIATNTGESFTVTVSAASTFFGFTTTQPFTTVTLTATAPPGDYDFSDDVYVGTSGTAAAGSDQCPDAPTITGTTTTAYPFTTVGATAQPSPGVCDNTTDTGPDIYFRYVAPVHGVATFNTCGCNFDSILRAYANCAAVPLGAQIACNDDFCTDTGPNQNRASQISFRVVAGEGYLIRISGWNGASGSGNLNFSIVADCRADFNHSSTITVQDIFDFLAAWFAGCP